MPPALFEHVTREFKIVHYGRIRIREAWGPDGKKARKFSILDQTTKQRTVKSCAKRACDFFRRRLKNSFLFHTKKTNQKNKGTN